MAQVTAIRQAPVRHGSRQALMVAIVIAIPAIALALYAALQEAWGVVLALWPFIVAAWLWTEVSSARLRQEHIHERAQIDARRAAILARQAARG